MPASRTSIPPQLVRKISPGLLVFTGAGGLFAKVFGMGLTVFGLFGSVVLHRGEHPHHSVFLYLFGPWVFPSIVALCFTFSPFRPYRGVVYMGKTRSIDASDPVAMRLAELFKSSEARRHLWFQTLKFSGTLFVVMVVLAIALRHSLSWSPSPMDLGSAALATTGSLVALSADYIGWGLTTWASRETAHQAVKE
jgi:hypothetical protein